MQLHAGEQSESPEPEAGGKPKTEPGGEPGTETTPNAEGKPDDDHTEVGVKGSEVLALKQGQPTGSLGGRWTKRLALIEKKTQKPLTVKQKSQLKAFAKAIEDIKLDPGVVIDYALDNWLSFGAKAQQWAGLNNYPSYPHIGFLRQYWNVLVDLYLDSIAPKLEPLPLPPPPPDPKVQEKALQLAEQNRKSIEDMQSRFAAAGEPRPVPTYNSQGELVYQATQKEIAETLATLSEYLKPALPKPSETGTWGSAPDLKLLPECQEDLNG
ncbi:MAG: hypothetical protein P4K98_08775 [Bryobacteraceae bacterium]|nr:hypothetical protein [Bryobacteraceae bacterium]